MPTPTSTRAWRALESHHAAFAGSRLTELFAADHQRFARCSLELDGLLLDYSKNLVDAQTLELLVALARECQLDVEIERMFGGEKINTSENRAVLHTALRGSAPVKADGHDVMPEIQATLARMREFTDNVRTGAIAGPGGRFTDVINIGIGGSHLGPALASAALAPYGADGPRVHYVSNVDAAAVARILAPLNPATTLAIVESKTFTTIETLTNARLVRDWLGLREGTPAGNQLAAVSAATQRAVEFGIAPDRIFPCWDWVGGRYSLWSAMGLPVALGIGMNNFDELLTGAHAMDAHFRSTAFDRNMPVVLALLGIWYNDFFGAASHAVLPYDESLALLPAHLQQLDMESSGKRVTRDNEPVDCDTGVIIWGATGTNAQHSFFQLLHQGTRLVPADFIGVCKPHHANAGAHAILMANFFAQTNALMHGAPAAGSPGNRPTNSILLDRLTPRALGMLIALYEHKVFVQNTIWGTNAFDQPGVELGKKLATGILSDLGAQEPRSDYDASTAGLIDYFRRHRT